MTTDVEPSAPAAPVARRRRRWARWVLLLLGLLLLVVVVLAVWGAVAGARVAAAARDVETEQHTVVDSLRAQDWAAAQAATARLQAGTARADDAAGSLPFTVATWLPVVGDDVRALRTVTASLDAVAAGTVEPLVTTAASLAAGRTADGGLDLAAVVAAAPRAQDAAVVAREAEAGVAGIDDSGLLEVLRPRVSQVREGLSELAATTDDVARGAALLPPLLGSEGPRTHLLVFQNLAEARPTGGIFGSWALVTADQGRLALAGTGSIDDLGSQVEGLDVPPEVRALYGADLDLVANINLSPDFPTGASLMAQAVERAGYGRPDAVLAVDPVALAAMLEVSGPVDVAGTTVSADNAAALLMNEAYTTFDGRTDERKAYLQLVTGAVFGKLLAPETDLVRVARAVAEEPVRDHVMVWSRDAEEQASLAAFDLTAALAEQPSDEVAVHLTNADGSKLDYFLRVGVTATCTASSGTVQVDLTNTAPNVVPEYVGSKVDKRDTTHRLLVTLRVPAGRAVGTMTADGQPVPFSTGTEQGWTIVRTQVDVRRDATVSLVAGIVGGSGPVEVAVGQPLVVTPDVTQAGACS